MAKAKFNQPEDKAQEEPFHRLVPDWGNGESKVINGQTAVFIPSPFPQFPGGVWVPYELSPAQFDAWHNKVMERVKRDQDREPFALDYWPERRHFFLAFELGNVTPDMVTDDGLSMPSMRLLTWLISIGSELIVRATSFPNLLAPSNGGANGNAAND